MARPGMQKSGGRWVNSASGGWFSTPTFEGFSVDLAGVPQPCWHALGSRKALILVHSTPDGRANPNAIAAVAEKFPHLEIVLGHPVFTEDQRQQAAKQVDAHPNLHLDLAYQADPATTEFFVREVGAERVLFGSDAPYFEPQKVIASIEAASISEAERDQIFSGAARRLIAAVG